MPMQREYRAPRTKVRPKKAVPGARRGTPPYVPTKEQRDQVKTMVAMAMTHAQIALVLKIERNTLAKHFREELSTSLILANLDVTKNLFHQTKTDFRAAQFWLINRQKQSWTNVQKIEANVNLKERPDLSGLTNKQLAMMRQVAALLRGNAAKTIEHHQDDESAA